MKVFSRKIQAITLLLATTATLLFVIKTHYEESRSMDAYMGNLRHSHLAPHDILAAEAEPVATTATAPSVKLHKEAGNVSVSLLRSESEVAPPDLPSSSAPVGSGDSSSEENIQQRTTLSGGNTTGDNTTEEQHSGTFSIQQSSLKGEGSNQRGKLKPEVPNSSSLVGEFNESTKVRVQVRGEKESAHGDIQETFVETLDFIHITKTGGTSIERAAAQIGIAWGYCKYHPKDKFCVPSRSRNRRNKSTMSMDTKCKIGGPKNTAVAPWHCPPNHLQMNEGKGNGKGGQTEHQVHHQSNINTSKTFAIVRDPYSRIISEYYWAHSWARKDEKHSTAEYLNSWIKEQLALVQKFGACVHGHCIPMYKYTHDELPSQSNTTLPRQVADHIIHLENITVELPALMEQYGHPYKDIQLGEEKHKGRGTNDKLDVHHLTNETLCMINRWAEMDFKLFGYEMFEVAGCFDGERAAFEVQQEQEQREETAIDPSHIVMTVSSA